MKVYGPARSVEITGLRDFLTHAQLVEMRGDIMVGWWDWEEQVPLIKRLLFVLDGEPVQDGKEDP